MPFDNPRANMPDVGPGPTIPANVGTIIPASVTGFATTIFEMSTPKFTVDVPVYWPSVLNTEEMPVATTVAMESDVGPTTPAEATGPTEEDIRMMQQGQATFPVI